MSKHFCVTQYTKKGKCFVLHVLQNEFSRTSAQSVTNALKFICHDLGKLFFLNCIISNMMDGAENKTNFEKSSKSAIHKYCENIT